MPGWFDTDMTVALKVGDSLTLKYGEDPTQPQSVFNGGTWMVTVRRIRKLKSGLRRVYF